MKKEKDTKQLLEAFFEQEKRTEDAQRLQEKIAGKTYRKNAFSWRKLAIPAVASVLLIIGISVFWQKPQSQPKQEIAKSQILYEDDDFVIYVQN